MDYVPMPTWKNHMIELLNIAGTGPIFGALMGAKWGPVAYLWVIFGCILHWDKGLRLDYNVSMIIGAVFTVILTIIYLRAFL